MKVVSLLWIELLTRNWMNLVPALSSYSLNRRWKPAHGSFENRIHLRCLCYLTFGGFHCFFLFFSPQISIQFSIFRGLQYSPDMISNSPPAENNLGKTSFIWVIWQFARTTFYQIKSLSSWPHLTPAHAPQFYLLAMRQKFQSSPACRGVGCHNKAAALCLYCRLFTAVGSTVHFPVSPSLCAGPYLSWYQVH